MALFSTELANTTIDISNRSYVTPSEVVINTPNTFTFRSTGNDLVSAQGAGFAFEGSDAQAGAVDSVQIDLDEGGLANVDIAITDLENTNLGRLDDGAVAFWDEVLKDDDIFELDGLNEAEVGRGRNLIFGDDLAVAGATNQGGSDTITGGDNLFDLIGDIFEVEGTAEAPVGYRSGNDTITSGATEELTRLIGDAFTVGRFATLNANNDILDNRRNTNADSIAVGDVFRQSGGTVDGGRDRIFLDRGATPEGSGDVGFFNGGTLLADDDRIFASKASQIGGDVFNVVSTSTSGMINGGNDGLQGSAFADTISGDVFDRNSALNTVLGGNDRIVGGDGNDRIFGEVAFGSLGNVSGGNDLLFGGSGNDLLSGQTGRDILDGGRGDDVLDGGDDIDTATYASAGSGVRVSLLMTGEQNTRGAGTDTLNLVENLTGSNFADMLIGDGGFNRLIGLGGDDTIVGNGGADRLVGGTGSDTLAGGLGSDRISGNEGNDEINGGVSNDFLYGNSGADRLNGGSGLDLLNGSAGADMFVFQPGTEKDRIGDFVDVNGAEDDFIDLTAFGFGSKAEIRLIAAEDNLILDLGGDDQVIIIDYLVNHAASEIRDDLLIV